MNIFTFIGFGGMLLFVFFFFKEFTKKPAKRPLFQTQQQYMPFQQQPLSQPMPVNEIRSQTAQTVPRQDYRELYRNLSKEMQIKKEKELVSSQSRKILSNPRDAFKTVDTDFEQAQTKMWGLSPLKQPIEPEEYNRERDSTMYWNRKQPTIYLLLAIISFILVLMMGV